MHPYKMRKLIKETLHKLPSTYTYNEPDYMLVAITLMNETKLDQIPVTDNAHVGMCGIDKEELKWFVSDNLRADLGYNDIIFNATGVDLNAVTGDHVYGAMDTNLSFMIAVTYYWYILKGHRPMNIEEALDMYTELWKGQGDVRNATKSMAEFNKMARRS